MPGASKKDRFCVEDDNITLRSLKLSLKTRSKVGSVASKRAITNRSHKGSGKARLKKKILNKAIAVKKRASKKEASLSGVKGKNKRCSNKEGEDQDQKLKRRRRKKKTRNNVELDEASKLQRRTRYLLIKLKQEQNLIDAYAAEGWKGQSREKIKPEKELLRAREQILKCKLGIREAIHQLDLLSSDGDLATSDGVVHRKNIVCAKCKLQEATSDNVIIHCDGTCRRAFHQKCLDPPMSSEDIPSQDEEWLCKFCEKKKEILDATNAHLGTQFPLDSNWEDVFREEAALPEVGSSMQLQEEEWPSDDSQDDDYDPNRIDISLSDGKPEPESDASGYSFSWLGSIEDESAIASGGADVDSVLYSNGLHIDTDEMNDGEVTGPRQRASVDYIKLYDEMFGKNAENEQHSEDEDWGPRKRKRKRKVKETDAASTLMAIGETDIKESEGMDSMLKDKDSLEETKAKKRNLRLPPEAVEELRIVFNENELPESALRIDLAKRLGLELDKVNKWFKNARYLALKARKEPEGKTSNHNSQIGSLKFAASRNGKKKVSIDPGDDVSLKSLRDQAREAKRKANDDKISSILKAEADMEKLCRIKSRVEEMQQLLLQLPIQKFRKSTTASNSSNSSVMYVPVAEVREKR